MSTDTIRDNVDRIMSGVWTFTNAVNLPANSVDQNALKTAALLPASKLVARFARGVQQKDGTAIVSQTELVHVAKYAGIVKSIEVAIAAGITGDNTVVIDVQKSSAGAAFATILTAALTINSASAVRTAIAATIDATKDDYLAGDVFQVVVTASGTGTQAQGLQATVFFEENPA